VAPSGPNHPNGTDADNRAIGRPCTVTYRPNGRFSMTPWCRTPFYRSWYPYLLTAVNPGGLVPFLYPKIIFFPVIWHSTGLGIRTAIPIDTPITSSGSNLSAKSRVLR